MSIDTLISLAILKVNWDKLGRDYVENFVIFVAESLRNSQSEVVSLSDLQQDLQQRFGLNLPLNPLKQILQRAANHDYVTKRAGIFYRNQSKLNTLNFSDIRNSVVSIHDRLLPKLIEHVRKERRIEWSEEDAATAINAFLSDQGLNFLYAQAEKTNIPLKNISREAIYLVASFLTKIRDTEPALLEDFTTLVKGRFLASAIYLPDPGRAAKRFERTKVFLDTSIVVYAIGYAGPERQAPCEELIRMLRDLGAELCCFEITLQEVKGILDACAARLRRGQLRDAYGPTIEWFIECGRSASDVELMIARLPEKLRSMGISVEPRPERLVEFQVDEKGFDTALEQRIGYRNPQAKIHDVDCIAAIAQVRHGQHTHEVESCGALFVTTNADLARESRAFFQPDAPEGSVALCITDYAFGNLLWLKNPTQAPELPLKLLLADAYAAIHPSDGLWKAYLAEIARLENEGRISNEEYFTLRHSLTAKRTLMDLTAGDTAVFTEGTVVEVLRVAQENLRADLEEKLAHERRLRQDTEQIASELENEKSAREVRIAERASRAAHLISKVVFIVVLILLAVGASLTFPWSLPKIEEAWYRYLTTGLLLIFFVYSIANIAWGTSVKHMQEVFEKWLAKRLQKLISSLVE